ncbi:MAG: amylo-alpha-1,6-glucosidase [Nitrospiraceae bacterium]|nr:amylo-alpha-1,6-glucosidase [Nitrospiraceae bacterium]
MSLKVTVGPPVVTINYGHAFLVSEFDGSVADASEQGLYARDTRFISRYQLYIDGEPWVLLNSGAVTYFASRTCLVNPRVLTERGVIEAGTVGLMLGRMVGEALHEDIDIRNYSGKPVRFNLELLIRADFADIFEVRSKAQTRRGNIETEWSSEQQRLVTRYAHDDFRRALTISVEQGTSEARYGNGRIGFVVDLPPEGAWRACWKYDISDGATLWPAPRECTHTCHEGHLARPVTEWKQVTTQLTTSNEEFYRLFRQSVEDMAALRLRADEEGSDDLLAAAGVPWFVSVFGRDSLIVSLQNMIVYPDFARGTLKRLAALQADMRDDDRDAEPGKIPHELRVGELAHFKLIPHTPYYGTADATILYILAWHEAWKWLGDEALIGDYESVILRCLQWIDDYGDRDGDGFQEYQTRSAKGYENMGWKDAGDAVRYPDGSLVKGPKALCELQGYVFDAKSRVAEWAESVGNKDLAAKLQREAAGLQRQFEDRFWCEDLDFYAYALDGDKKPVKTIVSNAGHLLWSGIVRPDRAARVIRRLREPDMWSGWGIRTLSANHPAYNPFSYHNGSVWPHDNGIIALGFKRYGFAEEAAMIARDISGAGTYFLLNRLPELYAGVQREPGTFPVQYLGANVPQAWAAGSVFHLLRAILGLEADAPNRRLRLDPALPPWLPDLTLRQLRVGRATVDLRFWRERDITRHEVLAQQGDLLVEVRTGTS